MLLIVGGDQDPNIASIVPRAEERGIAHRTLLVGAGANPALTWDFEDGDLRIDGEAARPDAVFARYDVFTNLSDPRPATSYRAQAWYATLYGWALASEGVRMLNRAYRGYGSKPFMLETARRVGLPVPRTRITNELEALRADAPPGAMIAKPVTGGGYTQDVAALLAETQLREGRSAAPAFVQPTLVPPEVRVYGVGVGAGRRFVAYRVRSAALDYRADAEAEVERIALERVDDGIVEGLGRLMDALEMDYAAADFKTDAETGRLRFLEINSSPMFAGFDAVSGHAVGDAILDYLAGG